MILGDAMTAKIEIAELVHGGRVSAARFQFEHGVGGGKILLLDGRPGFREGIRRDATGRQQQDTAYQKSAREDQGSPRCHAT